MTARPARSFRSRGVIFLTASRSARAVRRLTAANSDYRAVNELANR